MTEFELIEFTSMLLIEKKCSENNEFTEYFIKNSNLDYFNKRYNILLDRYLNNYALNKTEKSD